MKEMLEQETYRDTTGAKMRDRPCQLLATQDETAGQEMEREDADCWEPYTIDVYKWDVSTKKSRRATCIRKAV